VFALANPDPEITYPAAREARPDAIVATGRSDFPNQVNNVLGFPFIFRGALDARARTVNSAMMIAAVKALAELAREDVDDSVAQAYGGVTLRFGPDYIIPKPFDTRALLRVAPAVAMAASISGVARRPINDIEEYRARLEKLLGKEREVMRFAVNRARARPQRVVLADGEEDKALRAAAQLLEEDITRPILVGREELVRQRAATIGLDLERCTILHPETSELTQEFIRKLYERRCRKGMTRNGARRAMSRRLWFAAMLVKEGHADGLVCGLTGGFPETLRPVLQVVGTSPDAHRVSGVHLMVINNEILFFADTTLIVDPTAEQLAEIACLTADLCESFDQQPRVAMISFSNFGSVPGDRAGKVRQAVELVRTWRPDLEVEGEMHADAALFPGHLQTFHPFARLTGKANVLVFPSLEAGNVAQKVAHCSGAQACIGPILVGLEKPVNIVSHYASVSEIVMTTAITAMMAAARASEAPGKGEDGDLLRIARLVGKAKERPATAKGNGDRR
jgi:malate dehydrogenase (oxaloacetate-decarboxylating)(NADP+)